MAAVCHPDAGVAGSGQNRGKPGTPVSHCFGVGCAGCDTSVRHTDRSICMAGNRTLLSDDVISVLGVRTAAARHHRAQSYRYNGAHFRGDQYLPDDGRGVRFYVWIDRAFATGVVYRPG